MRIGFDAKRLYCNFTGLGNYSRTLVSNLLLSAPTQKFNLYTPRIEHTNQTEKFLKHPNLSSYQSRAIFKSLWRSFSIRKQLQLDGIELYHGLSNEIPFGLKSRNIKSVVTIHDLIFKEYPATYPLIDRKVYDYKFRKSCETADKIIAISEHTKKDITKHYGIAPEKIEVIYQACQAVYYNTPSEEMTQKVISEYNLPVQYLLFVGSIEKRKNLKTLLKAYQYLSDEYSLPLVIVGGRVESSVKNKLLQFSQTTNLDKKLIWLSTVKETEKLQAIYSKARALIYPSLYEGFGLPVAEALLSKTPVITSNVSSLPEAGGPYSLYINPENPKEIAEAITSILQNKSLAEEMRSKGYQFALDKFSPEKLSTQLMSCYKSILES
jgi:glycosyltransferase involved in cell wall biosynthesis